jgi:hypothetical protein
MKIKQILTLPTDKIPNEHQGVYSISCNDCDKVYIGRTNRQIKQRMAEHKNDTKNRKTLSAPSVHFMETGHTLNFENPTTLVKSQDEKQRILWESIHITKRDNLINFRDERNKLPQTYHHLISKNNISHTNHNFSSQNNSRNSHIST